MRRSRSGFAVRWQVGYSCGVGPHDDGDGPSNNLASRSPARCFPHRRGDGPSGATTDASADKFSPQAWGWTIVAMFQDVLGASFPHTRGDGPITGFAQSVSPRLWGRTKTGLALLPLQPRLIILVAACPNVIGLQTS